MGFLDKAKSQAQKLQETVTDKTSTLQRDRRAENLLQELGTLRYLELAGRAEPAHAGRLETLRAELIQLEADGTKIGWTPPPPPPAAPDPPIGDPPPPPPPPPPPGRRVRYQWCRLVPCSAIRPGTNPRGWPESNRLPPILDGRRSANELQPAGHREVYPGRGPTATGAPRRRAGRPHVPPVPSPRNPGCCPAETRQGEGEGLRRARTTLR